MRGAVRSGRSDAWRATEPAARGERAPLAGGRLRGEDSVTHRVGQPPPGRTLSSVGQPVRMVGSSCVRSSAPRQMWAGDGVWMSSGRVRACDPGDEVPESTWSFDRERRRCRQLPLASHVANACLESGSSTRWRGTVPRQPVLKRLYEGRQVASQRGDPSPKFKNI